MTNPLQRLIAPENIVLGHAATSAAEIISTLAARLQAGGFVRPSFAAAVQAREQSMPTGLPLADDFAVAVPHTDAEHVLRPAIALATLARPVLFGSMDDPDEPLPVHVVFLMALQDKDAQIDGLQAIGELLQDAPRARQLACATTAEDALALLS